MLISTTEYSSLWIADNNVLLCISVWIKDNTRIWVIFLTITVTRRAEGEVESLVNDGSMSTVDSVEKNETLVKLSNDKINVTRFLLLIHHLLQDLQLE